MRRRQSAVRACCRLVLVLLLALLPARGDAASTPGGEAGIRPPVRNPVRALDRTGAKPAGQAIPPVPEPNPARRRSLAHEAPPGPPVPPLPLRKPRSRSASGAFPLPERNPARAKAPPVPATWSPAEIAAAKADCLKALAGVPLEWEAAPPIRAGLCGAPFPISVKALGRSRVAVDPPALLTCPLAAALARWLDEVVQAQAKAELGSTVVGLGNATSYACRGRNGSSSAKLSEHAFVNALDIPSFRLADGRSITVAGTWGPTMVDIAADIARKAAERAAKAAAAAKAEEERKRAEAAAGTAAAAEPPPAPEPQAAEEPLPELPEQKRGHLRIRPAAFAPRSGETRFLHRIHAGACGLFGTVLGPEANEAHRDHLHVDMAKRRAESFCE